MGQLMPHNIKINICKVFFREGEETPGRKWEANIIMHHGEIHVKQKCRLYT
jgi:hypothetical protein